MRIMTRQQRDDLGLAKLPPAVRNYIAELETEYERVTTRQKRLRENIRAMQKKCELANLKLRLAQLSGQAQTVNGNVSADLAAVSKSVAKRLASQATKVRRAV